MSAIAETAIVERGIIFSAEMVRAILEDRKTQTRRVARFIPLAPGANLLASSLRVGDYCTGDFELGQVLYSMGGSCWQQRTERLFCPYGKVGDRLWVRETFAFRRDVNDDTEKAKHYAKYRASCNPTASPCDSGDWHQYPARWTSPIHMPRWASRITLEITNVKVERVQEISAEDAVAEGVQYPVKEAGNRKVTPMICISNPLLTRRLGNEPYSHESLMVAHFAALWDSINEKRGFGWDKNPWIWAISFRRIK